MIAMSLISVVGQMIWLVIWILAAYSIETVMALNGNSALGFVRLLLLISFYWSSQVLKNIVHVSCAGTFASWYFLFPGSMPANPTQASFRRACTTSLGSICLGSFIIGVIRGLRAFISAMRDSENNFLACCAECILRCLDDLISFFNIYAFTQVAIYGSSYCEAAKDTWNLISTRGFDLIVNDGLISNVLGFGCLIVGFFDFGMGMLFAQYAFHLSYPVLWGFVGFLVGFALTLCAMEVVESCIASCFVCFAEDSAALANTKPDVFNKLATAFIARKAHFTPGQIQRSAYYRSRQ